MKRISFYTFALLALCSCQKHELSNVRKYFDGTISYAVSLGQSAQTKAADEYEDEEVCEEAEAQIVLTDESGGISIPMECEAIESMNTIKTSRNSSTLTKGTQVNTTGDDNKTLETFADIVSTFHAKAYDSNGTEKVSQTVTWSSSSSAWVGTPTAYWPQATVLNFLAYANLPGSQTATIALTGVSTSHTVPATASEQTDILFGHYQGNGGNTGTAEIRFDHPLTAVRFKYGTMDGNPVIRSISLSGVAESGTATKVPDGTITWSGVDTYDYTVSQSDDSGLSVDATTSVIGEPFLIIPQKLTDNSVTVTVTFTDGTVVEVTLTSGEWKAGFTNTYILGYQDEWEYFIEGMEPVILSYTGGSDDMSVRSYRRNRTTLETEPVSWNLEYSADGENWSMTKPGWLSFSSTSGTGGTTGESLTATIAAQTGVAAGEKPVKERHDANLRAAAPKGTSTDRFDLSYFNAATGEVTSTRSTANTYVVSASGYYKIPLVYGNAIKNGSANTEAYIAPAPSEPGTYSHYLQNFVNHADKPISDPWIKNGLNANGSTIGSSGLNACIVWQDANNLVSNVRIDGDYLEFDVANSTITQGNCMVAVRNSSNTILWSWQIWVTDEDLSDTPTVTISGKQYDFMKVLLGWYSTGNAPVTSYAGRSCYVRANNGHVTSDSTVEQTEHEDVALGTRGSCTMYQWGRKDPFPGGDGDFVNKFRGLYQNTYNIEFCSPSRLEYVSVGSAIQHPWYMNFKYDSFWDWNDVCYTNFWNASVSVSDANIDGDWTQYKSIKTTKTIYDPSPVGFTLPNGEAYDGIVAQESGTYSYNSTARGFTYTSSTGEIFFPCCGYRNAAMLGMVGESEYWYDTSGFAIWSSTSAHLPTSFILQYDPDDKHCAGYRMTTANSNRPYLIATALIAE